MAKCNIALGEANAALSILRQATELEPHDKNLIEETANAKLLLKCQEDIHKSTNKMDYRTVS